MYKISLACGLLLLSLLEVRAQISAEIVMEQHDFLIGETIPAAVRITNRSGQTLRMGQEADWLTFTVESRAGGVVAKNSEVPVAGEFDLPSGKTAIRQVVLTPSFTFNRLGHFEVTATVRIKEWGESLATRPEAFEIVNAAKLWSQDFGMPQPPGVTNQVPEVRRYTLEEANYLRGKLRLYLRLTDGSGTRVIKVMPIGAMVSISDPEHQIDRSNRLHILYQYGARIYLYTVITPDGAIAIRQTHAITKTRPKLQPDDAGGFIVAGGERILNETDIPEPDVSSHDGPAQTP